LTINETAGKTGENIKFRLQYSTFADFSDDVHFVGEIGSSSPWNYVDGGGDDNDTIIGLVLSDTTQEGTFNEIGSSTNVYEHTANTAVEYDFAIRNNGAEKSQVYYFRAYDNFNGLPVLLNTDETYPSLSTSNSNVSYIIDGLEAGTSTEGVTTDIASAAGLLDFGHMAVNTDKIGAHRFTVNTNAGNGYQLFAYERQPLSDSSGSQFQPVPGTNDAPDIWPALPDPSAYGYHTSDATLSGFSPSRFLPDNTYSRFETNVKEVGYSPIPVQNETIDLIYRLEASVLQSAGSYETEVVYIIVPNF
jgi:archaellum component FlaG (FlaF/FlaG flagellin family)